MFPQIEEFDVNPMAAMIGAVYVAGSGLFAGPWGGGLQWRKPRTTRLAAVRARRKVRNRMAKQSRARNRK